MPTDTLTPAAATVGTIVAAEANNAAVSVDFKIIFIARILFLRSHYTSNMLTNALGRFVSFFAKNAALPAKHEVRCAQCGREVLP
jgi:hypothetical protein